MYINSKCQTQTSLFFNVCEKSSKKDPPAFALFSALEEAKGEAVKCTYDRVIIVWLDVIASF